MTSKLFAHNVTKISNHLIIPHCNLFACGNWLEITFPINLSTVKKTGFTRSAVTPIERFSQEMREEKLVHQAVNLRYRLCGSAAGELSSQKHVCNMYATRDNSNFSCDLITFTSLASALYSEVETVLLYFMQCINVNCTNFYIVCFKRCSLMERITFCIALIGWYSGNWLLLFLTFWCIMLFSILYLSVSFSDFVQRVLAILSTTKARRRETIICRSNPCNVEQHSGSTISIAFKFGKLYIVVLVFITSICHHCIKAGSDNQVSSRPISS